MIDDSTARHLENELSKDFPNTKQPLNIRPAPKAVATLADQLNILEKYEVELKDRIRRERGTIIAEHDRKWVDIRNDFDQRISEEVARLEKLRDGELKDLTDSTAAKLRDHEALVQRMEG